MKVKIVKVTGERPMPKTVEELRKEKLDCLKRNVLECCTRTIDESNAIAYALSLEKDFVFDLIVRTLKNYKDVSKEDE